MKRTILAVVLAVALLSCSKESTEVLEPSALVTEVRLTEIAEVGRVDYNTAAWLVENHNEWLMQFLPASDEEKVVAKDSSPQKSPSVVDETTIYVWVTEYWCGTYGYLDLDEIGYGDYIYWYYLQTQQSGCYPEDFSSYVLPRDYLSHEEASGLLCFEGCGAPNPENLFIIGHLNGYAGGSPFCYKRDVSFHYSTTAASQHVCFSDTTITSNVRYQLWHWVPTGKIRLRETSYTSTTHTYSFHTWYDYDDNCLVNLSDLAYLSLEHKNGVPLDTLAMFGNVYGKSGVCDTTVVD